MTKRTTSPRTRSKGFAKKGAVADAARERGGQGHNIWYHFFPKGHGDQTVSTDPHFLYCILLEADPEVESYDVIPQSERTVSGKKIQYRVDIEVKRRGGLIEHVGICGHDRTTDEDTPEAQSQYHAQQALSTAHGATYIRVYRSEIAAKEILIRGWEFGLAAIAAARDHSLVLVQNELELAFSASREWSAGELIAQFPPDKTALLLAAIFKTLACGQLVSDLGSKLWDGDTRLFYPGDSAQQPDWSLGRPSNINSRPASEFTLASDQTDLFTTANDRTHNRYSSKEDPPTFRMHAQAIPTSFTRKSIPAESRQLENWPSISTESLPTEQRLRFTQLRAAITAYVNGGVVSAIAKEQMVNRSEIYRYLNRALLRHPDGRIFGWRSLLNGTHVLEYLRTAPIQSDNQASGTRSESGYAGALSALFRRFPEIEKRLIVLILKKRSPGVVHEPRIVVGDIHQEFLRLCTANGLNSYDYPFIVEGMGIGAIRTFVNAVRQSDWVAGARVLGGSPAATRSKVGTGTTSLIAPSLAYGTVMQDGHKLDFIGSIRIPHPSGEVVVPLSRCEIQVVMEAKSHAILGYCLIFGAASVNHALEAVQHALTPWQPLVLENPPMRYAEGAGFPSGVIPELANTGWSNHLLDNGSVYTTNGVLERMRRRIGCSVNLGPVGNFTRRYAIEGLFGALTKRGFQRLPSTTGAHPRDLKRVDAEKKSVTLDMKEFIYIVDVVLASYNATPLPSLAMRSPLQMLKELAQDPRSNFIPRPLCAIAHSGVDLHIVVEKKTVRGNQAEGRRAYVEIDGARYTNALLSASANLIGKKVFAHINGQDMRSVQLYIEGGGCLGTLNADRGWERTIHDRRTRKLISKLIRAKELIVAIGEDRVQAYLRYLTDSTIHEVSKSTKPRISATATAAARVVHESGLKVPEASEKWDQGAQVIPLRPMSSGSGSRINEQKRPAKRRALY